MNQGTYPLAAAMINQFNRVDTIANNLANTNTNGFKQEGLSEGSFNNYLTRSQQEGFTPTKMNVITNTIPKIDGKYISSEQGAIVATGNQLDFALVKEKMFFKVQAPNGDILYTRDGSFKNVDGMLVTSNGNSVLNVDNEPIEVADEFYLQIGVVKSEYSNLSKVGSNNYRVKDINQLEFVDGIQRNYVQGSVEKSNVNSVTTMVSLIDSNRRIEQSQKAITSIGEMSAKLVQKLGDTKA